MKSIRFIALALAILTASSFVACGGDDAADTTAANTTKAPAAQTTQAPAQSDEPVEPGPDTPLTDADSIADILAGPNLQSVIDPASIAATGLEAWGDGAAANAFDGDLSTTKLGGGFSGNVTITWSTTVETTVEFYAIVTGGDSGTYGRVPLAWQFSGSTDGENWTLIDWVTESGIQNSDALPNIFIVDEPAAYSQYKFEITKVGPDDTGATTAVQFNEIVLCGEGAEDAPAETPAVDDAVADMLANGTKIEVVDPASPNMGLWDDGAVANIFDGTTATAEDGTAPLKLGGGSQGALATLTWSTATPTTLKNYVIYTCWDAGIDENVGEGWGRTPHSWALFGSNDGETWTALDIVANSGMENLNSKPYGFTVDHPAAYTQYTMVFTSALDQNGLVLTDSYSLSFNELVLLGDTAAAE